MKSNSSYLTSRQPISKWQATQHLQDWQSYANGPQSGDDRSSGSAARNSLVERVAR